MLPMEKRVTSLKPAKRLSAPKMPCLLVNNVDRGYQKHTFFTTRWWFTVISLEVAASNDFSSLRWFVQNAPFVYNIKTDCYMVQLIITFVYLVCFTRLGEFSQVNTSVMMQPSSRGELSVCCNCLDHEKVPGLLRQNKMPQQEPKHTFLCMWKACNTVGFAS